MIGSIFDMVKEPDPIKKDASRTRWIKTNRRAISRINNALGDLYRLRLHSDLNRDQAQFITETIYALEAEYRMLLDISRDAEYSPIGGQLQRVQHHLEHIAYSRQSLANEFVSSAKLHGSIRSVLYLLR
ncbi:MAG: hypothetical protein AAF376_04560 [Pseudomonadota bacterium]